MNFMFSIIKILRSCLVFVVIVSFSAFAESTTSKIVTNDLLDVPEDIEFFDEEGNKHFLEEYEGKTILLVFWATWCAPCVGEMKDLDSLQKDFRKLPFIILPISQDYTGVKSVREFYDLQELRHLPLFHDYKNMLFRAMNIVGLPTSILINASGKPVMKFSGAINWYDEQVREKLLEHIEGNPTLPKNSYKDRSLNNLVGDKPKTPQEAAVNSSETSQTSGQSDSGMSSGEDVTNNKSVEGANNAK
jgi:thiol-disulfide isomerase/thioredoxin